MFKLESFSVPAPANIAELGCMDTSMRYVKQLEGGGLSSSGLHEDPGTVLIDTASGLSRPAINTLHDYCLFKSGSGEFYEKYAAEIADDLREMGIEPPAEFVLAGGFSYPGSRSYAFVLNGKLVIT